MLQYKNWLEENKDDILSELIEDILYHNFNVNLNTSEYLEID